VLHQVEVRDGGFAWQGTTYRSLSEVARAITGTRWNGPRFFGLREVTGERIRDKIAASKRKGLWMGGHVPLGYRVQARKLVVDETEAAAVRRIFERYLALGRLTLLLHELRQQGIVTKVRPRANGTVRGGIAFTRGPLAYLLKNRTSLGEIVHRGECHAGEHQAILPRELFEAVQAKLASRRQSSGPRKTHSQALLIGKLVDDQSNRMIPSPRRSAWGCRAARFRITAISCPISVCIG